MLQFDFHCRNSRFLTAKYRRYYFHISRFGVGESGAGLVFATTLEPSSIVFTMKTKSTKNLGADNWKAIVERLDIPVVSNSSVIHIFPFVMKGQYLFDQLSFIAKIYLT